MTEGVRDGSFVSRSSDSSSSSSSSDDEERSREYGRRATESVSVATASISFLSSNDGEASAAASPSVHVGGREASTAASNMLQRQNLEVSQVELLKSSPTNLATEAAGELTKNTDVENSVADGALDDSCEEVKEESLLSDGPGKKKMGNSRQRGSVSRHGPFTGQLFSGL